MNQSLPCPVCGTPIPFDVHRLLKGEHFSCPNCQASIGLPLQSRPKVTEAMKKLKELKNGVN